MAKSAPPCSLPASAAGSRREAVATGGAHDISWLAASSPAPEMASEGAPGPCVWESVRAEAEMWEEGGLNRGHITPTGGRSWRQQLESAHNRAVLTGSLGLMPDQAEWWRQSLAALAAPKPSLAPSSELCVRFNGVGVWMPVIAHELIVAHQLDAVDDPELSPASHWAFEVTRRDSGALVLHVADITRALSGLKTQWLLETKVNFAITQALHGCIGVMSPETVVLPIPARKSSQPLIPREVAAEISAETPWVVKMDGTSGGYGVTVVTSAAAAEKVIRKARRMLSQSSDVLQSHSDTSAFHAVLQRYISRPLLIDGCKFGMRCYTLTYDGQTHIYSQCFVKLAQRRFDMSDESQAVHVTAFRFSMAGERVVITAREADDGSFFTAAREAELHAVVRGLVDVGELEKRTAGRRDEYLLLAWDTVWEDAPGAAGKGHGRCWVTESQRGPGCVARREKHYFSDAYLR